jgi:hypothetical protein
MRRLALGVVALMLPAGCAATGEAEEEGVKGAAIAAAKASYEKALLEARDLSRGPCIADPLPVPNWVADIAHDPRQPVDDEPANQCSTYRSGKSEHFVELDPEGNLIRAE